MIQLLNPPAVSISQLYPSGRRGRFGMPPALSGLGQGQLAARAAGDGNARGMAWKSWKLGAKHQKCCWKLAISTWILLSGELT